MGRRIEAVEAFVTQGGSQILTALAAVFLDEPSPTSIALLAQLGEVKKPAQESLQLLAHAAQCSETLQLRVEYNRLFYHPRGAPCPPWETVWRDSEPRLFGPRHESVLRYLRQAGLEPAKANESADHIGIELLFAAYCAEKSTPELLRLLSEFWQEHMLPWMPTFGDKVAQEARLPLFQQAGQLLFLFSRFPAVGEFS